MLRTIALIVSSVAATVAVADVYRWVDSEGQVHYSDTPVRDAERLEIESQPTDPARILAEREQAAALGAARELREEQDATQAADEAGIAADIADQRAANCEKARQRLESYDAAHRLYRPQEDGGREYLSDEELDTARADARLDVDEWCG
ncbi:MAG: DUF4124 domain-containing protein [Gammaproteobacteria bacterium]|nr:DUF4124 domain-containing protein [Gammaproteobacteria bacterium]